MLSLTQPKTGFRYSVDALLLAATVPIKTNNVILDAGAGVGAVGLHIAKRWAQEPTPITIEFCENDPVYSNYCQHNIAMHTYPHITANIHHHDIFTLHQTHAGLYDAIASNPPFHISEHSDLSPCDMTNKAKFLSVNALKQWIQVLIKLAKPKAKISIIMRPDDTHILYDAIPKTGVECYILPLIEANKIMAKRVIIGLKLKKGSKSAVKTYMRQHFQLHNDDGRYTVMGHNIIYDATELPLWRP